MNTKYKLIPEPIKALLRKTTFYRKRAIANKQIMTHSEIEEFLNQAPAITIDNINSKKPRVGIIKTQETKITEGYDNPKASWLRYERFCKVNNIPYGFYEVNKSDWMEQAEQYDIIVCHTPSNPSFQDMIESKIMILEKFMGKTCFPSFHEVWQYENKIRANYLYKHFDLPTIPTHITHSKKEAMELIKTVRYPFITKTSIGYASSGVLKVESEKQARGLVNKIFSNKGLKSQFPYAPQKDYLYIQEFIDDATFDLRIMLVGDMAFGYYRYPNKGDFRASGAGNTVKKAIPLDALKLAVDVRNKLNSRLMGVDLLYSEKTKQYYIIETSLFNGIDTPAQLEIDGIPGYYDVSDVDNINFKEGKFWVHELAIRDVVYKWMEKKNK